MHETLSKRTVVGTLIITFIGYVLFATFTDQSSFGLQSHHEETWAIWRYLVVGAWLLLAYLLFIGRNEIAYRKSFRYALIFSGIASLLLAIKWIDVSSGIAILGTAITCTMISGLLCMTLKRFDIAGVLSIVLVIVQLIVDVVVLGIAGDFRIH